MKIYFAGSIRSGREDAEIYFRIIEYLKQYGEVLTEHVGDQEIQRQEASLSDEEIHDRDLDWLLISDVIIAEVTTPSLGVGYEIGRAIENEKPVLCLFDHNRKIRLSAMISGSPQVHNAEYSGLEEAKRIIDNFFERFRI